VTFYLVGRKLLRSAYLENGLYNSSTGRDVGKRTHAPSINQNNKINQSINQAIN